MFWGSDSNSGRRGEARLNVKGELIGKISLRFLMGYSWLGCPTEHNHTLQDKFLQYAQIQDTLYIKCRNFENLIKNDLFC